jgi:hypothetical protein
MKTMIFKKTDKIKRCRKYLSIQRPKKSMSNFRETIPLKMMLVCNFCLYDIRTMIYGNKTFTLHLNFSYHLFVFVANVLYFLLIFSFFRFVSVLFALFRFNRNTETSCFDIETKQPKQTPCFG